MDFKFSEVGLMLFQQISSSDESQSISLFNAALHVSLSGSTPVE